MILETIEGSQLTALLTISRPAGQLFLPTAVDELAERYLFQALPTTDELIDREVWHFRHGLFEGNAFDLSIYTDGVILKSATNTSYLNSALDDVLSWAAQELGLIETKASKQQRYYESTLVVSLDIEVKSSLLTKIAGSLAKYQTGYGLRSSPFELAAISIAVDNMAFVGPKPTAFSLARQANAPFDSKLFVSTAPLQTDDHLELLHAIEQSWK